MDGRGGPWFPVGSKPGGELRFGLAVLSKQAGPALTRSLPVNKAVACLMKEALSRACLLLD